jgi:cell division septum initiation protein DivIVA
MATDVVKEILTEKRKIEKENMELEAKIQGKGFKEEDLKRM